MELLESVSASHIQKARLEALLRTTKALASDIHLERLLETIAEQLTDVLDAERSTVFLYDETRDELWGVVVQGMQAQALRFPANMGLAGHAARARQTVNVAAAQYDPRFNACYDEQSGFQTRSVLCAPILNPSGRLVGVVQALNKRSGEAFSVEDEVLLEAFSAHASLAIERAWLVERYAEQQRLETSLHVAHEMQLGMLPRSFPAPGEANGYDLYAHVQPAQTIGGDLYDFFEVDEDRLGFAVGDVSGKGIPASLFMQGTSTLLRMAGSEGMAPDRCFEIINRVQRNRKAMFVTLFYGLLDLRTGVVTYGNAGHPPPCVLHADGTVTVAPRAQNLPLGLLDEATFRMAHLQLSPGDTLVLFTDGVLEATNPVGVQFEEERACALLRTQGGHTARQVLDALIEAVHAFAGSAPQHDDLTALALRYTGR